MLFLHFLICYHFNMLILGIFCKKNQSPKSFEMVKYGILYVFYRFLIKTQVQRAQPFHTDLFLALPDVY